MLCMACNVYHTHSGCRSAFARMSEGHAVNHEPMHSSYSTTYLITSDKTAASPIQAHHKCIRAQAPQQPLSCKLILRRKLDHG